MVAADLGPVAENYDLTTQSNIFLFIDYYTIGTLYILQLLLFFTSSYLNIFFWENDMELDIVGRLNQEVFRIFAEIMEGRTP